MLNSFIPLHIYSGYSFFKSSIKLEEYILECKKRNYKYVGISDLMNLYSFPLFNELALKNNLTPLFGLEIKINDQYFVFYAKNEDGYRSLIKLSNLVNKDINKNLSFEDISSFKGLIAILSTSSPLFDKVEESTILNFYNKFNNSFENFYIGIDNHEFINQSHINLIREFLHKNNFKTIAFPLIKHLKREQSSTLKILEGIENNFTIEKEALNNTLSFHFLNNEEINTLFNKDEIKAFNDFISLIDFSFIKKRAELIDYSKETSSALSSDDLLKEKILEGLKNKNIDLKTSPKYRARLNYEYLTITKMGYSNYFLIVQDYVNYARKENILVGPGRGSAAGSLVSYLLSITDVDPLKYDLLFERFLNPSRKTMPDIDIDFQDVRRDEIITYLEKKYGYERVSRVIAFQMIKAKNAIRDVARVFGYPVSVADNLSKKIPLNYKKADGSTEYSLEDVYKDIKIFKDTVDSSSDNKLIFENAKLIEGLPRQRGLHAAGVVLSENSLLNLIPINYLNENELVTQYEKDYLENQGFLKFDVLGLSNLTIIANCLYLINKSRNLNLKFEDIPIDNPKIYKLLKEGYLMGLFQIDANEGRLAVLDIKPDNFKEIVDAISLARPGPKQYIPSYVARKNKKEKISYPSKDLEEILKPTYGIIIYQEQIMRIAQKYSSFTFAEADNFRRAISKKHADEILKMKQRFILGAKKNNHNEKEANSIFEMILKFAEYGFNQSHAVSYAMITAKMAYLKASYPNEFYSAILSNNNDSKFNNYLYEIKRRNIKIDLPNINNSGLFFIPYKNSLIFPLNKIKDVTSNLAINIVEERKRNGKYKSFQNFLIRSMNFENKINDKQLSALIDAGCFDCFIPNRKQLKMQIPDAMDMIKAGGGGALALIRGSNDENELLLDKSIIDDPLERMNNEFKTLGFVISDSLLNHVSLTPSEKNNITAISSLLINKNSKILGIIQSIKTVTVKNGKDKGNLMAFINVANNNEDIDVTIFSSLYSKYHSIIKENNIVLIEGRKEIKDNKVSFVLTGMKEVNINE